MRGYLYNWLGIQSDSMNMQWGFRCLLSSATEWWSNWNTIQW